MNRPDSTPMVRPPAVAGMFYPGSSGELEADVNRYLSECGPHTPAGSLVGLVVPHAGYEFSGLTAAYAFSLVKPGQFSSVVIVSPSHREYFPGISIHPGNAWRTPLGDIPVDTALRDAIVKLDPAIELSLHGHGREHAIEVQLPFLQKTAGALPVVPIVIGDQRRENCLRLGETLGKACQGKNVLLVASSDLSHYHAYDEAGVLDRMAAGSIASFDEMKLMSDLEAERCEACGGGPVVSVMIAARSLGADKAEILHACNSGDVTGDHSAVVGYLSAAFTRSR
jgi:MEMO1 family protein